MTPDAPPLLSDARFALNRVVDQLDIPRVLLLRKMAEAMTAPIDKWVRQDSDIATYNFEVSFSNQLLIHHATSDEPLKKKSFEYLLRTAFEAAGRAAELNPRTKSWDVRADGVRYALKTEAEAKMYPDSVRIQKLMDAQWVAECKDEREYAEAARRKFPAHLAEWDRILVLRVFRDQPRTGYRYQLLEVPMAVLARLAHIDPDSIRRNRGQKENRGFGADVYYPPGKRQKTRAFRVLFDRAVKKVRIHALTVALCTIHGEWTIPLRKGTPGDGGTAELPGSDGDG